MVAALDIRLRVKDGGGGERELSFRAPLVQIGRGAGNDLVLADPRVSTVHGRLVATATGARFDDLGSTNGSVLLRRGKRLPLPRGGEGMQVEAGDVLLLGDAEQPTTITVLAIETAVETPAGATVLAHRPLQPAAAGRLPEGEVLRGLLNLLAELRPESDTQQAARLAMSFLLQVFPLAVRADCFMKDSVGRFGPVFSLGQGGVGVAGVSTSHRLLEKLSERRQALLLQDVAAAADASKSLAALPLRSLMLAPLLVEGEVVGALQLAAREGGVFREEHLELLAVVAGQLSAALGGVRLLERLRTLEARLRGERDYLRQRTSRRPALAEMIGRSAALERVRSEIRSVAASRATVLIQGETGVGKELVARAIHEGGPRREAAFVAVNCAAVSPGLLESELFGHLKGAFTGAHREHRGLFEVADQGTLFLDEIGELPESLQPKLLRCLEEGAVLPVGASHPRPVDVRLVCATNRDLERLVAEGRFRQDLFYRINGFCVRVPPLRERAEDILPLAEHFLDLFDQRDGRRHLGFSPQAALMLQAYSWPGNVRQLRNEVERAALLAPAEQAVDREHLSVPLGGGAAAEKLEGSLEQIMERLERAVIRAALARHGGNRTHCAKELGISRQALIAKIARLGLED